MESLTPRQWAEKMLEREIYIEEMETQMVIDAPKVKFHDDFQGAHGNILMREAAKKIGWGEKKLFARLQQDDILISSSEPYQKYIDQGLFVMKTGLHIENGKPTQHATILVTPKGVQWLYKRYAEGIRERGKPYQLSAK
jgi:phage antirepressor YoqD-like protein